MDVILYLVIAAIVVAVLYGLTAKKKAAQPTSSAQAARPSREPERQVQAQKPSESNDGTARPVSISIDTEEDDGPSSGARKRPETAAEAPKSAARDLSTLRAGLARSRESEGFFGRLRSLFSTRKEIDPALVEALEEVLLTSDVGVATTQSILERIRKNLAAGELQDEARVWQALRSEAHRILDLPGDSGNLRLDRKPTVVLFVGVNGAGKTTTIGKLATKLQTRGKTCVLAAGDTFRAAAVQQLVIWGQRVGCEVVRGKDGADPGSVIFDAVKKAQEHGADVVLADTAGRLHTKSNLMAEMQKIARTTGKALEGAPHEVLLVIDATNGQNALQQAREFKEALPLSGIVLTKLDGTAKGGVLLGIADDLKLPVRFIGLGERPDDLHEFVADDFIEALLGKET